jgi:HD-GYP domain-containing protein (c-di-GMP phosphodiesterase class II)
MESRIIRAACVCQTALADPAGAGRQPHFTVEQLRARTGAQLDPRVVAAVVALIERASASE